MSSKEEIKKEVKKLLNEIKEEKKSLKTKEEKDIFNCNCYKKFDTIYLKYGQKAYKNNVPPKFRKDDIINLLEEQKFLELYNKHGEKTFNKYIIYIQSKDIEYETGSKIKSFFNRIKTSFFKKFLPNATAVALLLPPAIGSMSEQMQYEEKVEYSKQIETYIDNVQEYGAEISAHKLSDIQNIMKVMDDMWGNIRGYGEPKIDLFSYPGLDLANEDGVRSM